VRVAALYDIHGNLPALEAVLAEVERERFDLVVVGGDVFWGPWPRETLARLAELGSRARFVRGNCDRETFARDPADAYASVNAELAERLGAETQAQVERWPLTLELAIDGVGEVCFCHATPRSDSELVTPRTPPALLADALAATEAAVVVCGHTHVQFELAVGGKRLVNAGSVGWGYEGRPGAYWLELGPAIRRRRSAYDVAAAAAALAELAWAGPLAASDLLAPASREQAFGAFEAQRAAQGGRA